MMELPLDITPDDILTFQRLRHRIHDHAEKLVGTMPHESYEGELWNPSVKLVELSPGTQMVEVYFSHYNEQSLSSEHGYSVDIPYADFFTAAVLRPIKIANLLDA